MWQFLPLPMIRTKYLGRSKACASPATISHLAARPGITLNAIPLFPYGTTQKKALCPPPKRFLCACKFRRFPLSV